MVPLNYLQVVLLMMTVLGVTPCATSLCDDTLLAATKRATAIFTGKVEALLTSPQLMIVIKVKRAFKKRRDTISFPSGEIVRVVIPEGSENVVICDEDNIPMIAFNDAVRKLRVKDTKIFLVRKPDLNRKEFLVNNTDAYSPFELDSAPLPLTLHLLDLVKAFVSDMNYRPRTALPEEPCERKYCEYGADCVTEADGRAHCQCPRKCDALYNPVCGNDGKTYTNDCIIRKKACEQGKNIRIIHMGECGNHHNPIRHRG